jgi:hypothetical protein
MLLKRFTSTLLQLKIILYMYVQLELILFYYFINLELKF